MAKERGRNTAPLLTQLGYKPLNRTWAKIELAGHRSHLYQSNNELTAYLAAKIDNLRMKFHPEEDNAHDTRTDPVPSGSQTVPAVPPVHDESIRL